MWEFLLILEGHIHLIRPVVMTFPLMFAAPSLQHCGENYALVLLLARWMETESWAAPGKPPPRGRASRVPPGHRHKRTTFGIAVGEMESGGFIVLLGSEK